MRVSNDNLLVLDGVAQPVDMSTNINFKPIYLGSIVNYAIQIFFTGSPSGQFKLQMSNDVGNPSAPKESLQFEAVTNWTDVADSSFSVAAAGNVMWDVQNTGGEWVRVVYTDAGGTGTITSARSKVKGA